MKQHSSSHPPPLLWVLICLFMLAWGAMKISLPILPTLIHVFHVSSSEIKFSVSLLFICYGLSQLIWGGLSENKVLTTPYFWRYILLLLRYFKSNAAICAALSTTTVFLLTALFAWIESHLNVGTLWQISTLLFLVASLVFLINLLWKPSKQLSVTEA